MRGKVFIIIVFILLLSFVNAVVNPDSNNNVQQEVLDSLEESDEVQVIVMLKDAPQTSGLAVSSERGSRESSRESNLEERKNMIRGVQEDVFRNVGIKEREVGNSLSISEDKNNNDIVLGNRYSSINGFSAVVSKEGIKQLMSSSLVKDILPVKPIKLLLDTSVPVINGTIVHDLSIGGYNLTGQHEAVCVLDSGVDYTHPALGGCTSDSFLSGNCRKVIAGYDYGESDADPFPSGSDGSRDHGTHVAGIVASEDATYKGVAPNASIIAMRIFNDAGAGNTLWAISAIDWCVSNSTKFNISVITMSIAITSGGSEVIYSSSCDASDGSGLAAAASAATVSGLFVDASAGNAGNSTGITSPACGENVTSVGRTDDDDSVNSGSNSGSILDLFAPGSSVFSTSLSSSFVSKGGTSMSAPHVAGAAALLSQYWRLAYNKNITPSEITSKLKVTGKNINDTRNGLVFPRISILAAIQPYINFTSTSPTNDSTTNIDSVLINITSDVNLSVALLEWNDNTGTSINYTMIMSNQTNYYYNITNLIGGIFNYRVYGNDSANTFGTSKLRIITVNISSIIFNSPLNNSYLSTGIQIFNATVIDINSGISTVMFNFTNGSSSVLLVASNETSTHWNATYNLSNLAEEVHTMTVLANDTLNNLNNSESIVFTVDRTAPVVTIINASFNTSNTSPLITFNYTDDLALTSACILYLNNTAYNETTVNNDTNTDILINATLTDAPYAVTFNCTDPSGNVAASSEIILTIDATLPEVNITNPSTNSNFSLNNQSFNATANDASSYIDSVLFSITNGSSSINFTGTNASGNWGAFYNMTLLAEGVHNLTIYANDSVGNLNNSEQINFTIDRTAPNTTLISPTNASIEENNNSITFIFNTTDTLLDLSNCSLYIDTNLNETNITIAESLNQTFTKNLINGYYNWSVECTDFIGNAINSSVNFLNVSVLTPTTTLISPINNTNTSSSSVTFNCSTADDLNLANVTLYGNWTTGWHANQTKNISGISNSTTFSKTLADGTYVWNCLAEDVNSNSAYSSRNNTINVDTVAPTLTSVASGSLSSSGATITWTTSESANSSVHYGTSTSLSSVASSLTLATSQSQALSSLSASTLYYYNVTSCDSFGNCQTNGTNNFTTSAASSSSSSSSSTSSGGGGGGGGGGGTTIATAADTTTADTSSSSSSSSSSGGGASSETPADVPEEEAVETVLEPVIFTQDVSIVKGDSNKVNVDNAEISVKEIEINSKIDKATIIKVSYLPNKPEEVINLDNVYQYFEININLTEDEIKNAELTFEVPVSWLNDNNLLKETVVLNTFEDAEWKELSTKMIDEKDSVLSYKSKLKHFSYFSITAKSELEKSWFRNLIPPKFGTKYFVIFGLIILIAVLLVVYYLIREKDVVEEI
jgi:PGF-pre-PGF domain-containing protein